MKNYSLETWQALAEVDPTGTFNKLVKFLELEYSTADIILSDHNKDHLAACKYTSLKNTRRSFDLKLRGYHNHLLYLNHNSSRKT